MFKNILAVVQKSNTASENMNFIIIVVIAIIVILVASTIFTNKNK